MVGSKAEDGIETKTLNSSIVRSPQSTRGASRQNQKYNTGTHFASVDMRTELNKSIFDAPSKLEDSPTQAATKT